MNRNNVHNFAFVANALHTPFCVSSHMRYETDEWKSPGKMEMCWNVNSPLDNIKLISNVPISNVFGKLYFVQGKRDNHICNSQFTFQLHMWMRFHLENLNKMLNWTNNKRVFGHCCCCFCAQTKNHGQRNGNSHKTGKGKMKPKRNGKNEPKIKQTANENERDSE